MFSIFILVAICSGQALACDTGAIQRCQTTSFPDGPQSFTGIPRTDQLDSICGPYLDFKTCTDPLLASCAGHVLPDLMPRVLYTVAATVCSQYRNDILSSGYCWNNDNVQTEMDVCARSHSINARTLEGQCRELKALRECMYASVSSKCRDNQTKVLMDVIDQQADSITYPNKCAAGADNHGFLSFLIPVRPLHPNLALGCSPTYVNDYQTIDVNSGINVKPCVYIMIIALAVFLTIVKA